METHAITTVLFIFPVVGLMMGAVLTPLFWHGHRKRAFWLNIGGFLLVRRYRSRP